LSQPNSTAEANLRKEAELHGVTRERIIFAPRLPKMSGHLARQRHADLFLDTLPYNAHTTASDALWAGLPVLTCLGETFAGRVAASLLRAIGLPELITTSLDEYEALALKLASDPALLATIKSKLAQNRETYPLFDTARFTRHIEAAYTTMWERYQRGEPPAAFAVGEEDRIEQCQTPRSNANTANAQA
jgi:protein O-GlcNAc transferase